MLFSRTIETKITCKKIVAKGLVGIFFEMHAVQTADNAIYSNLRTESHNIVMSIIIKSSSFSPSPLQTHRWIKGTLRGRINQREIQIVIFLNAIKGLGVYWTKKVHDKIFSFILFYTIAYPALTYALWIIIAAVILTIVQLYRPTHMTTHYYYM